MLEIGVIGSGFMAQVHLAAWEQCSLVDRVRLLTRDAGRSELNTLRTRFPKLMRIDDNVGEFYGSSVDAVDICTPTALHADQIRAALAVGKPILCEKPMTLDSVLCEQLAAEADAAHVPLMIAHVLRFWPEYAFALKAVREGELGDIHSATLMRYCTMPAWGVGNWFANLAQSGGALFDLHVHDIDFALGLLGVPRRVSALGIKREGQAYTEIQSTLDFGNAVIHAFASYEQPVDAPFRMSFRIRGEKAALEYDLATEPTLQVYPPLPGQMLDFRGGPDGYALQCSYFAECIATGVAPLCSDAHSAARTIKVLEALQASADSGGEWLQLPASLGTQVRPVAR